MTEFALWSNVTSESKINGEKTPLNAFRSQRLALCGLALGEYQYLPPCFSRTSLMVCGCRDYFLFTAGTSAIARMYFKACVPRRSDSES